MPKLTFRMLALSLLVSGPALAQGEAAVTTAREIAKQGLVAYDTGNFEEAAEKLSRAYEVVQVPTLALYTARALVKVGKLVRASEIYLQATRLSASGSDQKAQEQAQRDATRERQELMPKIPMLIIRIEGAGASEVTVSIDGTAVPNALLDAGQLVDPGTRSVVAARGAEQVREDVTIAQGDRQIVALRFTSAEAAPAAAPPPATAAPPPALMPQPQPAGPAPDAASDGSTQRTLGWVTVGVGGVGLVAGGVAALLASSKRADLEDGGCVDNHCFADQASDVDSYNSLRSFSTAGFIVGGVGLGAGLLLLLTAPEDAGGPETAGLSPFIGVGTAGVRGRF